MFTLSSIFGHFCHPSVMGILNVTPDSFAAHCKELNPSVILADFQAMVQTGVPIIDIGGCSTRPNSAAVSEQQEWERLDMALAAIRAVYPNYPISIDTFRASIAQRAIERYGVHLINDISGMSDGDMLDIIARTHVPYVLTHPREACEGWCETTDIASCMLSYFANQLDRLHRAGIAEIIIDPGVGFGKSMLQNYAILHTIPLLKEQLQVPVMVGLSRKSMIYQALSTTPQQALNGTIAAHTLALCNGADILRVHDIVPAQQTITIIQHYLSTHI